MLIDGGDKITIEANDIEFKGNTIRGNEIYGNMAPLRFLTGVYKGLKVGADAVLAASIFHYGEYTIEQAKKYMSKNGIQMRNDWVYKTNCNN